MMQGEDEFIYEEGGEDVTPEVLLTSLGDEEVSLEMLEMALLMEEIIPIVVDDVDDASGI